MKKFNFIYQIVLLILLSGVTFAVFAWDQSVELGYGYSHDPRHTSYNNSGFLLSGDLYPFYHSPWTYWSLNGALGRWHTTEPVHQNLTTAAVDLALRFYPFTTCKEYPAYLLGSVGPVYLSTNKWGFNKQGSNVAFQINAGLGVEVNHHYDFNLRMVHFSNAYLAHPDQGFTVLYLFSIGYLF